MLDWVDISLGTEREFNGSKIPWCAELHLTREQAKEMGKDPYLPTTIERKSKIGYNKGTRVFLIDDASGTTWIMKGMQIASSRNIRTRSLQPACPPFQTAAARLEVPNQGARSGPDPGAGNRRRHDHAG